MVRINCLCSECKDIITEPLCIDCFQREFFVWMNEQDLSSNSKLQLKKEILSFLRSAKSLSFFDYRCIVCHKKMRNICFYCLMEQSVALTHKYLSKEETELVFNYNTRGFGMKRT